MKNWRLGWRFNALEEPQYEIVVEKVGATQTYPGIFKYKISYNLSLIGFCSSRFWYFS